MAKSVLERLHYSRADLRLICAMIGEHLRPSNLASNDVITDRGAYHFSAIWATPAYRFCCCAGPITPATSPTRS